MSSEQDLPKANIASSIRVAARIDAENSSCAKSEVNGIEPSRAKERTDSEEPKTAKSSTAKAKPKQQKLWRNVEEPGCKQSKMEAEASDLEQLIANGNDPAQAAF